MSFSIPPNESTAELLKIFGLDKSKVTEFHISVVHGKPTEIQIKQLVDVEELQRAVEVLRKYKLIEDV